MVFHRSAESTYGYFDSPFLTFMEFQQLKSSANNKYTLSDAGLRFAASSPDRLSTTKYTAGAPIQYQTQAVSQQTAAGIQLAARVINRTRTNSSINTINSGGGSISSPFFTTYVPSTAVGATVPAPGAGITPSPRVTYTAPSHSQGFVRRRYTPITHRLHF